MIREKIKASLEERSWTIQKLHEESGVRYASISEYLNGGKEISSKNLEIIFKSLSLSFDKEENLEIENPMSYHAANLAIAFLRCYDVKTWDLRSFEFWNKNECFLKVFHLLNIAKNLQLTEDEKISFDFLTEKNTDGKLVNKNDRVFLLKLIQYHPYPSDMDD